LIILISPPLEHNGVGFFWRWGQKKKGKEEGGEKLSTLRTWPHFILPTIELPGDMSWPEGLEGEEKRKKKKEKKKALSTPSARFPPLSFPSPSPKTGKKGGEEKKEKNKGER